MNSATAPPSYEQGVLPAQPMMVQAQPYQPMVVSYPYYIQHKPQLPSYLIPNDYIIPSIIILVISCIFNITALFLSIPALGCAMFAWETKTRGIEFYPKAKRFGFAALILNIVALLWIFICGFVVLTTVADYHYRDYYYYY
ncbi:PREDICTED: uncharacterized protein LOC100636946 [Amphimedon queenslandica]|uniref:Uncharacterized protein n=1 Tax=Amphimedon queenslandica TaxID=400682 RepID=A0A1X7VDT0_AMPQE|nr:PREDICTED: uncharacterized protein LOC100636946 [Amphimedon queenslandica]|eukprot:XP_003384695.1 PREDICTED: uncharacterized protein LOC100636946 [Amphimedon queenslandica]